MFKKLSELSDLKELQQLIAQEEHYKLITITNLTHERDHEWSATFVYECTNDDPDYVSSKIEDVSACRVIGYEKYETDEDRDTFRYSFLVHFTTYSVDNLQSIINRVKHFVRDSKRIDIIIDAEDDIHTIRTYENEFEFDDITLLPYNVISALEFLEIYVRKQNEHSFNISNNGDFYKAAQYIETIAKYLGFNTIRFEYFSKKNSAKSTTDEIMFGKFDNLEYMLIALFHEAGHRLAPQDLLDQYESKLLKEAIAWIYGIRKARQLGIQFSDDAISYAIDQLKTYVGYDVRETRRTKNDEILPGERLRLRYR